MTCKILYKITIIANKGFIRKATLLDQVEKQKLVQVILITQETFDICWKPSRICATS